MSFIVKEFLYVNINKTYYRNKLQRQSYNRWNAEREKSEINLHNFQ